MAKVSVIMPAYNVAPYIGAAIESALAQTMPELELLVVDDGSTDETRSIAEAYAAADPRVRVVSQANAGISAARNHALRIATGDFIAILDSDDLWEPQYLASQLAVFEAHPRADIVTGNGWLLGGPYHGRTARPWPDARPQPTLASILADEESIFIMSIMRRRVYETIGGFDETLRTNEDYDFWLRAAAAGFAFRRNDQPLSHYRRRDDSLSAHDVRMLSGILTVYEKARARLGGRPAELRIIQAQTARFERERLAAQAREALNSGDTTVAADRLSALYRHSGGGIVRLASFMARWTPKLLRRAYQRRRARQQAAS